MSGFIKLMRGKAGELMQDRNAWSLVSTIAYRARRTNGFNVKNLKPGEALLGDYKNYGMSKQEYRTAKAKLAKWKIATFRATPRGTIAKLVDNSVYDINLDGKQHTEQHTSNTRATPNKEQAKNEKKEKKNQNKDVGKSLSDKKSIGLVVGKDKAIAEAKKHLAENIARLLRPVTGRERTTFRHVLNYLVAGCQSGKWGLEIFQQAEDWLREAKADGVKAKKLFVHIVKSKTGFAAGKTGEK